MGTDKAFVELGGSTFLERVAGAMAGSTESLVLLGDPRPGFESWADAWETGGPLAGIATALQRSEPDRVLVVAVDNALVRRETLQRLAGLDSALPIIPVDEEGVRQVTCAIYPTSLAAAAAEEATAGGSVQSLLDRTSFFPVTPDIWRTWDEDGRSWLSIDTPEALAESERLLR